LLLFDLPARQQRLRLALWRWLRGQRFGYLQHSVWIVPDPIHENSIPLRHLKLTPESLTVIEGAPAPPDTNADIVRSAWDFVEINRRYMAAIDLAIAGRRLVRAGTPAGRRSWLSAESVAWADAVSHDPVLPEPLLPADYLGQKAWNERQITFALLGKSLPGGNKT
jgi:DNA-binding transcriptional regulator PaaX